MLNVSLPSVQTIAALMLQVCRGLFEAHRPLFSFLIATAIQRTAGTIPGESWSFLLRGAAGTGKCSRCDAYAMNHMPEPGFWTLTATALLNTSAIPIMQRMDVLRPPPRNHST